MNPFVFCRQHRFSDFPIFCCLAVSGNRRLTDCEAISGCNYGTFTVLLLSQTLIATLAVGQK